VFGDDLTLVSVRIEGDTKHDPNAGGNLLSNSKVASGPGQCNDLQGGALRSTPR
jgi:hypothetical protein